MPGGTHFCVWGCRRKKQEMQWEENKTGKCMLLAALKLLCVWLPDDHYSLIDE